MNGILHFIKKELIITTISLSIFAVSFYLYQSQKKVNKKELIEDLKQTIISEKSKLKKDIKEYKKEKEFEKKISNLKIVDVPLSLDIYKTADELKKVFYMYFGTKDLKVSYKPMKIRTREIRNHVFYRVNMIIPYTNKYEIIKFLDYLKNNYFITTESIDYDTKNKKFKISFYLLGKKGKTSTTRRRRRFF